MDGYYCQNGEIYEKIRPKERMDDLGTTMVFVTIIC